MNDDGIQQASVIIDRMLVFLDRPEVGEQLLVLLGVLIASRLIARVAWWGIDDVRWRRARRRTADPVATLGTEIAPLRLLRAITAPLIGIALATFALHQLAAAGRVTGLLRELIVVFFVLFAAELVMTALSLPLDDREARRYRRRFFKPLMWIIVGLMVLDHLSDVSRLAKAPVFDLFGSPISVGALFIATLGLWFWTDAINLLNTVVVSFVVKHTSLNDGSAEATLMLVRYALILLGIAYGVSQLQLSPATVAAITGGLSVGVGFGLREVLANFISGTFMLFERSLRPGDIVEVDEQMGIVERLSVRSTTVLTLDNEEIVIPNSAFFTDKFKSFTGSDRKVRFNVVVLANCRNEPEKVRRVLKEVAMAHPEVLDHPEPEAWVEDQFGNNVVSYRLHMWSASPLSIPRLRSDIVRGAWKAFHDEGIELVFPDLELTFNETAKLHIPAPDDATPPRGRLPADVTWRTDRPDWEPAGHVERDADAWVDAAVAARRDDRDDSSSRTVRPARDERRPRPIAAPVHIRPVSD